MSAALIKLDDLRVISQNDEPRIPDWKLAVALGFDRPRKIRELIERNRAELERYGRLPHRGATSHDGPGARPVQEYWLNEAQALLICMKSDAPRAADVRQEIITVYQAWRRGELASVRETPITNEMLDLLSNMDAKLDRITKLQTQTIDDIARIGPSRRFFTEPTIRLYRAVLERYYNNECPALRRRLRPGEKFVVDHWFTLDKVEAHHGWMVAEEANQRLANDPVFKQSMQKHFDVFQDNLRRLGVAAPVVLRRRVRSRTMAMYSAFDLFDPNRR